MAVSLPGDGLYLRSDTFSGTTSLPLRLIMIMGFIVAGLSALFGIFQIIVILVQGSVADRGIPTLIIGLFFFSGVNAVFLGVIGEYVGRIYHQTRYGRRVAVQRLLNFAESNDTHTKED